MNQTNLSKESGFGVSEKYVVIDTEKVLNGFEKAGFELKSVQKSSTRNPEKEGFQKHLIRLSHPDTQWTLDGLRPEIILKNAYDGSSSFNLRIGVYRFICSNGLEVGSTFESERVRHIGSNVIEKVLEAAERIKTRFPEMQSQIEAMKSYNLSNSQVREFVSHIGNVLQPKAFHFNSVDLLKRHRSEDRAQDAFSVLNVIQENALNGHYRYQVERSVLPGLKNGQTEIITRRGRRLKSIDRTSEVNQAVWNTALKLIA